MAPKSKRGFARVSTRGSVRGGAVASGLFAANVRSGLNLYGRFQRGTPVVVKRDGPSPAFAQPFTMSARDRALIATAELAAAEGAGRIDKSKKRELFLHREAAKKAQVQEEENALIERLSSHPMYGRRGIINARFRLRGRYYPTFAPYFEERIARLTALMGHQKWAEEKDAYMDELEKELDSWTFKI